MDYKFVLGIGVVIAIAFFAVSFVVGLTKHTSPQDRETLYQVSTNDALMHGEYEGVKPFSEIKNHGDFGLGTLDALDSEMVAVEGNYYQVKTDMAAHPVTDNQTTPFMTVTFFESDITMTADRPMNYTVFSSYVTNHLPTQNMISAVRIDGTFPSMKTRSVPRQEKPYLTLVSPVANQTVKENPT